MTLYVHRIYDEVGFGEHTHVQPPKAEFTEDGRCWTIDCPLPGCEDRLVADCEFVARTAVGVPLTVEEQLSAEHEERSANRDATVALRKLLAGSPA